MKIGENDAAREVQNSIYLFVYFFDDLHLQIIESISPKASVENSSPAIFITMVDPHIW